MTTESDTTCRKPPEPYRSHNPWREANRRAQCEEIRTLRSMWRGLETWQGRDAVTLASPKGRETGNTNFDLHRRASPRPYRNWGRTVEPLERRCPSALGPSAQYNVSSRLMFSGHESGAGGGQHEPGAVAAIVERKCRADRRLSRHRSR
jgi:hypothetical protein